MNKRLVENYVYQPFLCWGTRIRGRCHGTIKSIDNSKNHVIIVMCAIVVNATVAITTNTGA